MKKCDELYVKAYEEELTWSLLNIYNRSNCQRKSDVEEQMRGMYDRLVVVCQLQAAEKYSELITEGVSKGKGSLEARI